MRLAVWLLMMSFFSPLHAAGTPNQTPYELAAEAAWNAVIMSEDRERFQKEGDLADSVEKNLDAASETVGARAKELFLKTEAIHQVTAVGIRERIGAPAATPESTLDGMLRPGMTYIFVSQSIPEPLLVSLFAAYENNADESIEIVFRGLNKDQRTIPDMLRSVGKIIHDNKLEPAVNIGLNPTVFRHFNIQTVPAIVHILPDGQIAKIQGILNVNYFMSELRSRTQLDLGVQGALYEISERDLLEIIQERLAAIDLESAGERAQQRYWENFNYQRLPNAVEPETFYADMRVRVTQDIQAVDGTLVAKAGDIVDPFHYLPGSQKAFNRRVIALNPNSTTQVEWARTQVREAHANHQVPLVMLSELHASSGGQTLFDIEAIMGVRIFLLVPEVVQRFGLNALPASAVQSERYPYAMLVRQWHCDGVQETCRTSPEPD